MPFISPVPLFAPSFICPTLNSCPSTPRLARLTSPRIVHLSYSSPLILAQTAPLTEPRTHVKLPPSLPELAALRKTLPTYFRAIQNLHAKFQSPDPPPVSSVSTFLSPLHHTAIQLQTAHNHQFVHLHHLVDLLAIAEVVSPTSHHLLIPRLSPVGPLRDLLAEVSLFVTALIRRVELSPDVPHASPLDLLYADRALRRYRLNSLCADATLRNPYFCCVSWDVLRSHRLFVQLPPAATRSVSHYEHLAALRQDSDAFAASQRVVLFHAATAWRLLGYGEESAAEQLGELLPPECVGHKHALAGWRALLGGGDSGSADEFDRRFATLQVPNALISYLEAEQAWFDGITEVRWAPALRMHECGLVFRVCEGFGVVGCAPVGKVERRVEEDFWGWSMFPDRAVIAKTESVYKKDGTVAEFKVVKPRARLDAVSFVEAQVTMVACGDAIKSVDVVWHSIMGGMRTFRVKRDDDFITLLGEHVAKFREKYAGKKPRPPPAGFQAGGLFDKITELVVAGCENAECVHNVTALVDELRVGPFRRRTPDKFKSRNERVFLPEPQDRG